MLARFPEALLFPYLAVALTLVTTVLGRPAFLRKYRDFKAVLLYFASFFTLLFALPCLIILVFSDRPIEFFRLVGFSAGRAGRGLLITAVSLPAVFLSAVVGSADRRMRAFYPYAKTACAGRGRFVLYGFAYFLLYYLPWEFTYRGLLFFPILAEAGLPTALAVQTGLSTLHHRGHPPTEILAAAAAGIAFGLIAYATRSFFYTTLIHALVGIGTDAFICLRSRRTPAT